MDNENNETTATILKEIIEKFAMEKLITNMFITEKGLMGEFTKYIQAKDSEFEKKLNGSV